MGVDPLEEERSLPLSESGSLGAVSSSTSLSSIWDAGHSSCSGVVCRGVCGGLIDRRIS
jgi:hypothetical protein